MRKANECIRKGEKEGVWNLEHLMGLAQWVSALTAKADDLNSALGTQTV